MAANRCICMTWGIVPPCALVVVLALYVWAHVPARAGLLLRGEDFSCEAETCRVLTVDYRIKVHMDLQADKSPVVVKGPFFT
jgi:hypothetical protein